MTEVVELIAVNGVWPVIVGVVLYIILRWQNNKHEKEQAAQKAKEKAQREQRETDRDLKVLELFKQTIVDIRKTPPEHTVEEEEHNRKIDDFIISRLDYLVNCGASRSYIMTFHNGIRDMLGRGFAKMSMTGESIGENSKSIISSYQSVPRAIFPVLYRTLNESGQYIVSKAEDIRTTDPMTYQFLNEHSINTAIFKPIKREDGLMLGFLAIEFDEEVEDLSKFSDLIAQEALKITGAMVCNSLEEGNKK